MPMRSFGAMIVSCSLFGMASSEAGAVIIDFGTTVIEDFDPGETYSEEGFILTVLSGSAWEIGGAHGNPISSLEIGDEGPIGTGDTISLTRADGGPFTFDAFDFANFVSSSQSDWVHLLGFVDSNQTEARHNVSSTSSVFTVAFDPLFSGPIDELRIVGADQGETTLFIDNLVLTRVPEPGTLVLLGFGLVGLGFASPKRQRSPFSEGR